MTCILSCDYFSRYRLKEPNCRSVQQKHLEPLSKRFVSILKGTQNIYKCRLQCKMSADGIDHNDFVNILKLK